MLEVEYGRTFTLTFIQLTARGSNVENNYYKFKKNSIKITNVNYLSCLALAFVKCFWFISTVKICLLCSLTLKYVFAAVAHTYCPPLSLFAIFLPLTKCN